MKELSIEEKAKAYDEAIKKAESLYKVAEPMSGCNVIIETLFPELKESEDERIRKDLIIYLRSILSNKKYGDKFIESWIDWLEKQGEHARFRRAIQVGDQVTKNEDGVLVNISQLNRIAKKKGGKKPTDKCEGCNNVKGCITCADGDQWAHIKEQKSTDKVEPKFHEGDWVVCEAAPKFTGFKTGDVVQISNKETLKLFLMFEDCFRLWDITKDAKDGDVLVSESQCGLNTWYCIFKSLYDDESMTVHCYLSRDGRFETKKELCFDKDPYNTKPATKEQRDTLMKAMADAGYTFNFENKELKKVEQKSVWGEEDEKMRAAVLQLITDSEKENGWNCVYCNDKEIYFSDIIDWLKSLRPQNMWKPSDEQIKVCKEVYADILSAKGFDLGTVNGELNRLEEQLKKLREE